MFGVLAGATLIFYGIYLLFVALLDRVAPGLATGSSGTSASISASNGAAPDRSTYQSVADDA